MKRLICMGLAALALSSCVTYGYPGNGFVRTEIRDVQPFTILGVHDNIEFSFTESKTRTVYDVKITSDDNLLRLITTNVVNGRLDVRVLQPIAPRSLKLEISGPPLTGFAVSSRAKGTVNSLSNVSRVHFDLSTGGQLTVGNLECNTASAQLVTGALLELQGGSAGSFLLGPVANNSKVKAENFRAGRVEAQLSGQSTAEVHAINRLTTSLIEASNLFYKGNPQVNSQVLLGNSRLVPRP